MLVEWKAGKKVGKMVEKRGEMRVLMLNRLWVDSRVVLWVWIKVEKRDEMLAETKVRWKVGNSEKQ